MKNNSRKKPINSMKRGKIQENKENRKNKNNEVKKKK